MSAIDQTLQFAAGPPSAGQPGSRQYATSLYSSRGTGVGQSDLYHSALLQTMRGTGPQSRADRLADTRPADRPSASERHSRSPVGSTTAEANEIREQSRHGVHEHESQSPRNAPPVSERDTPRDSAPEPAEASRSARGNRPAQAADSSAPTATATATEGSPPALLTRHSTAESASTTDEVSATAEQPALDQLLGKIASDQEAVGNIPAEGSSETGTGTPEPVAESQAAAAVQAHEPLSQSVASQVPSALTTTPDQQFAADQVAISDTSDTAEGGAAESASGRAGNASLSDAVQLVEVHADSETDGQQVDAADNTASATSPADDQAPQTEPPAVTLAAAAAAAAENTGASSAASTRGRAAHRGERGGPARHRSPQHVGESGNSDQAPSGTAGQEQPGIVPPPQPGLAGQQNGSESGTSSFGSQSSSQPPLPASTSGSPALAAEPPAAQPPPADAGPQPAATQQSGPGALLTEGSGPATTRDATATRAAERLVERVTSAMRQLRPGGGQLRILLQPVELGELRIELQQRADGVTARMEVTTPEAQQMLAERLPRLQESLASRGIVLDSVQIELSPRQSSREQQRSGQQRQGQEQQGSQGRQQEGRQQQGRRGRQQSSGQQPSPENGSRPAGSSRQQ